MTETATRVQVSYNEKSRRWVVTVEDGESTKVFSGPGTRENAILVANEKAEKLGLQEITVTDR